MSGSETAIYSFPSDIVHIKRNYHISSPATTVIGCFFFEI